MKPASKNFFFVEGKKKRLMPHRSPFMHRYRRVGGFNILHYHSQYLSLPSQINTPLLRTYDEQPRTCHSPSLPLPISYPIVYGVYRKARPRATATAATAISLPQVMALAVPLNWVGEGVLPVNVPFAVALARTVAEAETRVLLVRVLLDRVVFGVTDATGVTDGVTETGVTDTGVTDTGVTDTGVTDTGVTETGVTDTGVTDTGVTEGTGVDNLIVEV